MAKKAVAIVWATASIAADTDWFASDVSAHSEGSPVRHTLQATLLSTDAVINLVMTRSGVTKTVGLNGAVAVVGDSLFQESFIVFPGTTYNVQHAGSTNVIFGTIMVDEDDLNIS